MPLPSALAWRVLADTARFNEAMAMPKYRVIEEPQADGSVRAVGEIRRGFVHLAWEEPPVDWVAERGFRQVRRFLNGPLRELVATLTLEPGAGPGATVAVYEVDITPRNALGRWIVAPVMLRSFGRRAEARLREAGERLAAGESRAFALPPRVLTPAARVRAEALVARLEAGPYGHGHAAGLLDHLVSASDLDVSGMRPLAFARRVALGAKAAVELFLAAAHYGLLEMQWDIVCPRCRGAKARPGKLRDLPRRVHCASCNVDYGADFSRNVEITFRPASWLRDVEAGEYCLMGPGGTPHVLIQQHLAPGERRVVEADLAPGTYGLRGRAPGPETEIIHSGGGLGEVIFDEAGIRTGAPGAAGRIVLANGSDKPRTVVIEAKTWRADALTAKAATALQIFRVLFPDETLSAGEDVAIDRMAFLFTDLRGSTALYERVGDSEAYRIVRQHFAFLEKTIADHDGCVVKTIGDAVLAVFASSADAVRAARAVRRDVSAFNGRIAPNAIRIRLGLHAGPCVAVTLNGRLDYFGSAVNLAARLEAESRGDDIVLSAAMAEEPGVTALLAGVAVSREDARLRGFDRPIPLVRLGGAAPR